MPTQLQNAGSSDQDNQAESDDELEQKEPGVVTAYVNPEEGNNNFESVSLKNLDENKYENRPPSDLEDLPPRSPSRSPSNISYISPYETLSGSFENSFEVVDLGQDNSRSVSNVGFEENVVTIVWRHDVQQGRSDLSARKILLIDGSLFTVSAISSLLYYYMTKEYVRDMPNWKAQSFLWCTYLSTITLFLSSLNGLRVRYAAKIMPPDLRRYRYKGLPSMKRIVAELVTMGLISAWVSTSLVTAASRYPDTGSDFLQISWETFVLLVNLLLHLSPVEEVYAVVFKVLAGAYDYIGDRCLSMDRLHAKRFEQFKYIQAQKLCDRFIERLDAQVKAILDGHFVWTGCSSNIKQCMSYVKKLDAWLSDEDKLKELSVATVFDYDARRGAREDSDSEFRALRPKPVIDFSKGKLAWLVSIFAYLWVFIGMGGYEIDPFIALNDIFSRPLTDSIAIPAFLILLVLIGRLVGDGLKADANTIVHTCKERKLDIPFHGRIHTKSFALMLLFGCYKGPFSTPAAEQIFLDRKGDFPDFFDVENYSSVYMGIVKSLFIYLTISTLKSWYHDYVIKIAGCNQYDENRIIVLFQQRIEYLKQHIRLLDPDLLVRAFETLSPAALQLQLGMTVTEFKFQIDFQTRFADFQKEKKADISLLQRAQNYCKKIRLFGGGGESKQSVRVKQQPRSESYKGKATRPVNSHGRVVEVDLELSPTSSFFVPAVNNTEIPASSSVLPREENGTELLPRPSFSNLGMSFSRAEEGAIN